MNKPTFGKLRATSIGTVINNQGYLVADFREGDDMLAPFLAEAWNSATSINKKNPQAVPKNMEEVVRYASSVMELLALHGASIVSYLLDNDDNAGECLRQALSAMQEEK